MRFVALILLLGVLGGSATAESPAPPTRPKAINFKVTYDKAEHGLITLDHAVIKIGRAPSSHLKLDFDDTVSRMHAIIEQDKGTVAIIDLGSARGTFVNGTKVNKAALKSGDVLVLGSTTIVVSFK